MRLTSRPVLLHYYLTYRCNARCGFCDIWERPSPLATLAHIEANLRAARRLGIKVVDFTGGEPLLHPQLPDALAIARDLGLITTVTTNTLLYPRQAKRLAGLVDMLHFSLDYADLQRHSEVRKAPIDRTFDESIERALTLGERPDILMTLLGDNLDQIAPIYERYVKGHGLVLILNPGFDYGPMKADPGVAFAQVSALREWARRPGVYLNEAFLDLRLEGGNQISAPVCRAASTTVVVSPHNGLVLPCYHLGLDELTITDAQPLDELWGSTQVQQLVALEGRHTGCQGCAVNCYMQPSFAVELSRFWLAALPSTLKYNYEKGTWRRLIGRRRPARQAVRT